MPTITKEERPKNLDNDPTMREEDNQGIEEKAISEEVEKEDQHNEDDDDYSLNFHSIPTKPKRSDLSALVAKLERRRSKDAHRQDRATPIELEESRDVDVAEGKTVISQTRITVESTDEVDAPNEPSAVPITSPEISRNKDESINEIEQPREAANEEHKEVELPVPEDAPVEKSSEDSLSYRR